MTDVVIAGIGQTPVGEHWEVSLRSLAVKVMLAAIKDAGGLRPQALYVGNMLGASPVPPGPPGRPAGRFWRAALGR